MLNLNQDGWRVSIPFQVLLEMLCWVQVLYFLGNVLYAIVLSILKSSNLEHSDKGFQSGVLYLHSNTPVPLTVGIVFTHCYVPVCSMYRDLAGNTT